MTPDLHIERCPGFNDIETAGRGCTWVQVERARIDALAAVQTNQSAGLTRLETKVDALKNWMMGATVTFAVALVVAVINLLEKAGHAGAVK